ncbi:MAG TPA: nucleotidyltransferase domain-containing protein [Solirubrobacteraceae bacterium]
MFFVVRREVIEAAGRRVIQATGPRARVIAFGSIARGEATADSDLDLLVIEPAVNDTAAESTRLRGVIGNIGIPVDVVVVTEAVAERRAAVVGTVVHAALRDGWVVAES